MQLEIIGPQKLIGEIEISGSKNSALAIISATVLIDEKIILKKIPGVEDVFILLKILEKLGKKVKKIAENTWEIDGEIKNFDVPFNLASKLRASIYLLGPLTARFEKARICMPGGCSFGPRPINFHIEGLKKMGIEIKIEHGFIEAKGKPNGVSISFPKKSVGTTIHLILTSIYGKEESVFFNTAQEPEVIDCINFLKKCGAKIKFEGSDIIKIKPVEKLKSCKEYQIIPDRIEAGTYLAGAVITKGRVKVLNVDKKHIENILVKFQELGVQIKEGRNWVEINCLKCRDLKPLNIETAPYPGFPTDMQPQFMAILTKANGTSYIREGIYPRRFLHAYELIKMGADIDIGEGWAVVRGVEKLTGAFVDATDLRAGASLLIAGYAIGSFVVGKMVAKIGWKKSFNLVIYPFII
ncbi:UDP-N-acetylglucosamine 1-carboxyvinyltransferase, partial [Candidatus Pacearchaeota archaeon]